jgi:nicotinamide-nucleotide amidase
LDSELYCPIAVNIELINTGSELLLGRVLNTHQQWLGRQLAGLGYRLDRQSAVPDTGPAIEQAVREALARADLIIVTGGLGPTSDDLTRDLIAGLLGKPLSVDGATLERIETFFASRGRPAPPRTKVQALVPQGAVVLANAHGTAPGLVLELAPGQFRPSQQPGLLILLPGPPRELRPMFAEQVAPILRQRFPLANAPVCLTLKTTGLGESVVEEYIAGPLKHLTDAGLEIGYCARIGEVEVRLSAGGPGAAQVIGESEAIVRGLMGPHIFGVNDEELESVIVRRLTERKETLALAESCTGGHIANRLTDVAGASVVLWGGLVTYSNEAKQLLLGVRTETLAAHGAVSEATAREMAEGAQQRYGTDFALAVTGIAGPGGGTDAKPVGTVFISLAERNKTIVQGHFNRYDRPTFKFVTSQQALELLRRRLAQPG